MKILACVKQVPDTEAKPRVTPEGVSIEERDIQFIMNPYDEFAAEAAVRLKESASSPVLIVLVTIGPSRADDVLRLGLAMGADEAKRVSDPGLDETNGAAVATVLAAIAKEVEADLILCGRLAIDDGMGEVPLRIAARLGYAHVTSVTELAIDGDEIKTRREIEGGTQLVALRLPAVITTQKGLNEPRYPAIPAIMKARQKPIETVTLESLGVEPGSLADSPVARLVGLTPPPSRSAGQTIDADTPEEAAMKLAVLLRDQAKVL